MKKLMKCIMVAFCLAVAVAFAAGVQTTNVQAKKKVTYKLKKGTLTIKGKGNMPKKIKVEEAGDSEFLPGTTVDVLDFNEVNEEL